MRRLPYAFGLALVALSASHAVAQTSYPLTIHNCGTQVDLVAAPARDARAPSRQARPDGTAPTLMEIPRLEPSPQPSETGGGRDRR